MISNSVFNKNIQHLTGKRRKQQAIVTLLVEYFLVFKMFWNSRSWHFYPFLTNNCFSLYLQNKFQYGTINSFNSNFDNISCCFAWYPILRQINPYAYACSICTIHIHMHIFRTPFSKNTSGWLFLFIYKILKLQQFSKKNKQIS